uniref:Uncharacterized protein LOC111122685 n=1 Tax=Crassostrea virginica TaxID=6565 RepID=A0A8B8D0I1_CRAVI|nr:uncharacterized protein LOC111122685 [Crassostrea virginica]
MEEELHREFTCPICADIFTNPKGLPCLHSFCRECLRVYITKQQENKGRNCEFSCPVCRHNVVPPDGRKPVENWVDQFPSNHQIISLMDLMLLKRNDKPCRLCQKRDLPTKAVNLCRTCQEEYCADCSKFHLLLKATKTHKLFPLENVSVPSRSGTAVTSLFLPEEPADMFEYTIESSNCQQVKVLSESDNAECWITGAVFLEDDKVLMADNRNMKLKLFSADFKLLTEDDSYKPYDIALMDNETVAVSDSGCVRYCDIEMNSLKPSKTYNTDWKIYVPKILSLSGYCRGICCSKGKVAVCSGKDLDKRIIFQDIEIVRHVWQDIDGKSLFREPWYCVMNESANLIFVADGVGVEGHVICITTQGRFRWKRKFEMPRGLCVCGDHLFVADMKDNSIKVISLDGKEVRTLLTREDGIQRPQSVAINNTGDKLLVSSCPPYNNDYVSIFDLKYKKGERRRPVTAQPVVRAHRQSDLCSVS